MQFCSIYTHEQKYTTDNIAVKCLNRKCNWNKWLLQKISWKLVATKAYTLDRINAI